MAKKRACLGAKNNLTLQCNQVQISFLYFELELETTTKKSNQGGKKGAKVNQKKQRKKNIYMDKQR